MATIVLGPPGCGKTTYLLARVQEEMERGVPPSRIAYVSFTRKAATEAVVRACEKFGTDKKQFPYFSTLHALAFAQLGLTRQQVMGASQYKIIGNALGLVFSDYMDFEEGMPISAKDGDQVLYITGMARATLRTLEEQFKAYQAGEVSWFQLKQFSDTLEKYKLDTGMVDFSDMLDHFRTECQPLDIEVAFIDEAQDLSRQQWAMVLHAIKKAKRVFIAGDDDQAIYRWSGADVDSFLELRGERLVLDQSYRLPIAVHSLCNRISERISRRFPKTWRPRDEQGSVDYINTLADVEWKDGTYLLLARNRFLLQRIEEYVRMQGIPYTTNWGTSVKPEDARAIIVWEKLRRGDHVSKEDAMQALAKLRVHSGVKRNARKLGLLAEHEMVNMDELRKRHGVMRDDIWHEALEMIAAEDREFYLAALRRREKISRAPRVHISTIHGVKGGEADHVVLMSDMAARTYMDYQKAPDDEHRVAYVGASRARRSLSILMPQSQRAYDYR